MSSDLVGFVNVVQSHFTPLTPYSFMVLTLIYIPCLSTVATIRKEIYSVKWTVLAVVYPIAVAYVLSLALYQIGQLFI